MSQVGQLVGFRKSRLSLARWLPCEEDEVKREQIFLTCYQTVARKILRRTLREEDVSFI